MYCIWANFWIQKRDDRILTWGFWGCDRWDFLKCLLQDSAKCLLRLLAGVYSPIPHRILTLRQDESWNLLVHKKLLKTQNPILLSLFVSIVAGFALIYTSHMICKLFRVLPFKGKTWEFWYTKIWNVQFWGPYIILAMSIYIYNYTYPLYVFIYAHEIPIISRYIPILLLVRWYIRLYSPEYIPHYVCVYIISIRVPKMVIPPKSSISRSGPL